MEALLIKSDDKEEMRLLNELVKKMGLNATALSEEDMEDLGLSILMRQADRNQKVSREEIMEKLNGK